MAAGHPGSGTMELGAGGRTGRAGVLVEEIRLGPRAVCRVGIFLITLAPALGFFNVYFMRFSFVADHFQYLASVGIIALIVGSMTWEFDQRIKSDTHGEGLRLAWMKPVLGLLVLLILVSLTWKRGLIYRDQETLWQDTLNKNPNSWLAHNNLGNVYLSQGRPEEAIQEFLAVLKLRPN